MIISTKIHYTYDIKLQDYKPYNHCPTTIYGCQVGSAAHSFSSSKNIKTNQMFSKNTLTQRLFPRHLWIFAMLNTMTTIKEKKKFTKEKALEVPVTRLRAKVTKSGKYSNWNSVFFFASLTMVGSSSYIFWDTAETTTSSNLALLPSILLPGFAFFWFSPPYFGPFLDSFYL